MSWEPTASSSPACTPWARRSNPARRIRRGPRNREAQIHRPLPRRQGNLVVRLRLRWQRASRQEMLRAAHRLGDGARRGLARRAHADPRPDSPRTARRRYVAAAFPSRLRQDEPRDADSAEGVRRLEGDHRRRGHRLDQAGRRRPLLRDQSRSGILRRRARHLGVDQPERDGDSAGELHLHERRAHP